MPLRVLFAHEFDPAGVHIGYREALRAAGVEAYAAARQRFMHRADFDLACSKPDVVVVAPGVGDSSGWATREDAFHEGRFTYEILPDWVEALLNSCKGAKRVALFHGSPNLWAYRSAYARHWHERGFALAATTLDYATELDCTWLPPAVVPYGIAKLRGDLEPLAVVHTPSVPTLCHTIPFIEAAFHAGAIPIVSQSQPHHRTLWLKTRFHAGFDHFRGSFSVNALENAATGLASIFGLKNAYAARMRREGIEPPSTAIECDVEALKTKLAQLVDSPKATRDAQIECLQWWNAHFEPEKIAQRLVKFFEEIP